jgi:hypothetical protein
VASCEGEKGWKEIQESRTQDIEDRGEIILHGAPPLCGRKVFSSTSTAAWCAMTDRLLHRTSDSPLCDRRYSTRSGSSVPISPRHKAVLSPTASTLCFNGGPCSGLSAATGCWTALDDPLGPFSFEGDLQALVLIGAVFEVHRDAILELKQDREREKGTGYFSNGLKDCSKVAISFSFLDPTKTLQFILSRLITFPSARCPSVLVPESFLLRVPSENPSPSFPCGLPPF